jgi:DNA-binding transcriptional LysR family regulator
MNLHQLNCFIAVAQHLNFTEASKRLHIAQSAVSHNIAELEKELDAKLFIRNPQFVTLTSAGEVFLKEAFQITSLAREAATKTKQVSLGQRGKLAVGFVFTPIVSPMVGSFKRFRENFPNIDVHYNSYDSVTMSRLLDSEELDIGFARLITLNHPKKKAWWPLYRDPLYVIVPGHHPIANESKIDLKMIKDEPIILMNREANPGMFDVVTQLCMNSGFTPQIIDNTNNQLATIMMVQIGMGIIILPGRFRRYVPDDLKLIPIDDEEAYHEIGVVINKHNSNPAVEFFLKELGVQTQKM